MGSRLKKMALVLGAGSVGEGIGNGNGRAIAMLFAREGARVAGVDVSLAAAEETARLMVAADGNSMLALEANVTKEAELHRAIEATLAKFVTGAESVVDGGLTATIRGG